MAGSENEPATSSSGSSEGSESESEPENTSAHPPSSKKTQPTPDASTDESESESDSDKTHEMPQLPDPKKPRSKNPTSRYSPPPLIQPTRKRPAAEGEGGGSDLKKIINNNNNKKKKTVTVLALAALDAENGGEKKQLFQRLWSEDNEIELIQGMIDYVEEKGKDPVADVNDFHEFVKKSLHVDVNDSQVLTKARRLKKKYRNNVAKVENKGKVRSFSNPHEKKMYELSKILWGSDSNNNAVMRSSMKKVKVAPKANKSHKAVGSGHGNVGIETTANDVELKVDRLGLMGLPFTDEVIVNKGLELLSGPKKVEMEEKWKNLKMQELEHFLKKVDVLKEQAEVVLNAIANSGAK